MILSSLRSLRWRSSWASGRLVLVVQTGRPYRHVGRELTRRLVEALAGEPAWRRRAVRRHAKRARRCSRERPRTARKATRRAVTIVERTARAAGATERRVATWWELALWGEVRRRLLSLILQTVVLPWLCLMYLLQSRELATWYDEAGRQVEEGGGSQKEGNGKYPHGFALSVVLKIYIRKCYIIGPWLKEGGGRLTPMIAGSCGIAGGAFSFAGSSMRRSLTSLPRNTICS